MSKLVATNFLANLTRFPNGTLNSGKAIDRTSFGTQPWTTPGSISFTDQPDDITDILDGVSINGKPRVENGLLFIYTVTHKGKLYKIQVNDIATKNIEYDKITLITQMITATSFTMGGGFEFWAGKIYVGHDAGVSAINFDGSGEEFIGVPEKWDQNVPRQTKIFFSQLLVTNGSNIAVINNVGQVITYTTITDVLDGQIFKTIEVDSKGTSVNLVSSDVPNTSLVSTAPNVVSTYIATSYIFNFDPKKNKVNSIKNMTFDQTAALTVGSQEFIWGYNVPGGSFAEISDGIENIASGTGTFLVAQAPTANAVARAGNLVGWATVEPLPTTAFSNKQGASVFLYGNLDRDEPELIYARLMSFASSLTGGDIIRIPWIILVGNIQTAGNTSGYGSGITQNETGTGRIYMSTVEFDGVNTAYKLYSLSVVNPFLNPCAGVYETQAAIANTESAQGITGSTFVPTGYDVYMEPATGYEEYTLDLIGIDGLPLTGATTLFTSFGRTAEGSVEFTGQPSDGEIITITDGDGTTIIFEFDDDASVSGMNIAVTIGATKEDTAATLETLIEANLHVVSTIENAIITITDITPGITGNADITSTASNLTLVGMAGGVDINISPGDIIPAVSGLTVDPTPVLGIRVTNSGLFTPIIHKIEVTV